MWVKIWNTHFPMIICKWLINGEMFNIISQKENENQYPKILFAPTRMGILKKKKKDLQK